MTAAARLERRRRRGARAWAGGRFAETVAALWLMAKGWRIVAVRLKTPRAEIDILVRKGRVLAAVEVKRRATLEAARQALDPRQAERLRAAMADLVSRRPDLQGLETRLDMVALAPRRRPRHIAGL